MNKGIHDYVSRQAADLGITKSAFVENAIYHYPPPKQLHLDHLAVPDIDGLIQTEFGPSYGTKEEKERVLQEEEAQQEHRRKFVTPLKPRGRTFKQNRKTKEITSNNEIK
jgi:hypothetical protein